MMMMLPTMEMRVYDDSCANMGQLGPLLLQLSAHLTHLGRTLATIFGENLTHISPKTPQAAPNLLQDPPDLDFGRFSTHPDPHFRRF